MPVRFEIDVTREVVMTTVTGTVSVDDLLAYQAKVTTDARFSPEFAAMVEFREGSVFTGTGDDIRRLAQTSPYADDTKRAYVVASDLHFGLSRMAQEYADMVGRKVEVFRDRNAALDWLDRGRETR